MDQHLLDLVAERPPRVLIVPTAAAHERPDLAAQNGIRHFTALGARASDLMAISRADWEGDRFLAPLTDADLIYLTGGDPWYLLQTIRDTVLLSAILHRCGEGAILVGSSAGAMVLGESMRQRTVGWAPALGVVPGVAVAPHYRPVASREALVRRIGLPDHAALVGIGEATGCVWSDDGRCDVVGPKTVSVVQPTGVAEYRAGQGFSLSLRGMSQRNEEPHP
jgi:cyanophycinase